MAARMIMAAPKQHTTRPYTSTNRLLRPQLLILVRFHMEYPIKPINATIIMVVTDTDSSVDALVTALCIAVGVGAVMTCYQFFGGTLL